MLILILGGTTEGRLLASRLIGLGHEVITSLAGRTSDPILPEGELRVGKFGGVAGLVAYLEAAHVERVVDATHPYAEQMSANAVSACHRAHVRLVRLVRPPWPEPPGSGWLHAESLAAAAHMLPSGAVVLLTTGHDELATFLARDDCRFVIRLIKRPELPLPPHASLLLTRPPYELEDELTLFERRSITHLVTKNSGGSQTSAKLEAARELEVQVIMVDRPALAPAIETASITETIEALHLEGS
jgi:precorrin-6A/cobalt-precorrin-6A reductase